METHFVAFLAIPTMVVNRVSQSQNYMTLNGCLVYGLAKSMNPGSN